MKFKVIMEFDFDIEEDLTDEEILQYFENENGLGLSYGDESKIYVKREEK